MEKKYTHLDFDDFTVETVQHNYDIISISGGISSIMSGKKKILKKKLNLDK